MDETDLEKLGLNKNEAKVYLALLYKGQATASELVKSIGVHRNIVYDNLEKLMDKGLVSVINDNKKIFIAEKPTAILDFLESKKLSIDKELSLAKNIIPDINKLLASQNSKQEAHIFRGLSGLKKVLSEIVQAKKSWCIGITSESVRILGDSYWKNYNLKKRESKTEEWLLWNSDYKDSSIGNNKRSHHKILPKELNQVTETIIWDNKVAIFVYSSQPMVIIIDNLEIAKMHKAHFEFLWKISKN
ncbi:MAG: TrmB family transcriptional regulator [Candidatus Woesearchaeota archaeon]